MKVDLHPEESLDRERADQLGPDERRRLDEHSKQCVACAFERRATADFAELLSPFAGDDALVARLLENTMNPPRRSQTTLRPSSGLSRPPRLARALLIAAVALIAGIAAAAAAYKMIVKHAPEAPAVVPPAVSPNSARSKPPPAPPAQSADQVPDIEDFPDEAAPAQSAPSLTAPRPSGAPSTAIDGDLDAGELFARGNKARRSGSYSEAVRYYNELQKRFPGSREAHTSQVALGGLLLNQLGNASGALGQFNAYLASGGVLSEEASAGRALALGRLGRSGEERQAWQQLLDRYPQSVNAERARQRLQELK